MSIETRQRVVNSPNTVFQHDSQRSDLLGLSVIHTEVIAMIAGLIDKGHVIEFTAIKSDHGPDACLGLHSHQNGYAFDCWPLVSTKPGDYADAASPQMASFIQDIASSPYVYQIGLAGSAQTDELRSAAFTAGKTSYPNFCFLDDGADHIHVGCQMPQ